MILAFISFFNAPIAESDVSITSQWSFYLFIAIIVICAVVFIYFLRRTDKLVKTDDADPNLLVTRKTGKSKDLHGEEAAAIALAIHFYKSEMHDMESFTITLQKVSRIYSPWSSKIYTLRQNPRN